MKSAIALTRIWNHYANTIVQPDEEFAMSEAEIDSLIAIKAAKETKTEPQEESTNRSA